QADLAQVGKAGGAARFLTRLREHREENGSENSNDGDHHEQLNERESGLVAGSVEAGHGSSCGSLGRWGGGRLPHGISSLPEAPVPSFRRAVGVGHDDERMRLLDPGKLPEEGFSNAKDPFLAPGSLAEFSKIENWPDRGSGERGERGRSGGYKS